MADLLDEAVARVRKLPVERQYEAAELLIQIAEQDASALRLSEDQRVEIRKRLAAPPDLAADAEVEEAFDRLAR